MSETCGDTRMTTLVWHRPLVSEEARDRLARRQANAAVALLRLQREPKVWPLLEHRPDPRTRSYLIHRFRPLDADPKQVLSHLDTQEDVSIRRALLLILGEFSEQHLPLEERARLVPRLLDLYANDPDPGIHGAVAWTLRQWGRQTELGKIDLELATGVVAGKRRWFVNRQGQTLVIIPPPGEFVIGSPPWEFGREDGAEGETERQRYVRIDHPFALMTHLVTVAEFLRFRKGFTYRKRFSPTLDCPINNVSWFDAVAYCNWLNDLEGIPKEQWCYLPNDQGEYEQGMRLAPDFLRLGGYRLPTEAEWEYACRASSVGSRYYGQSPDLDKHYSWNVSNSLGRWTVPVGTLKPSDWGLFDMMGNVMEWCQSAFPDDSRQVRNNIGVSQATPETVREIQTRSQKGQSFLSWSENIRSAYRYRNVPNSRIFALGFRVGMTCWPNQDITGRDVRNDQSLAMRGAFVQASSELNRSAYGWGYPPNMQTYGFGMRAVRTMD